MKKSELRQIIKEEIHKVLNENLDPLKPQNNDEKLLSPPKNVKDNKGNNVILIGQEYKGIYWDNNGDRWTQIGKSWVKYEMSRYDYVEYKKQPNLEPEEGDMAWDNAYNEHTDYLKIFVNDVLNVPYKVNLGMSDGEDRNTIYITSKIYGENPTTFTTYHRDNNGEIIDYEYNPYKPINLSSDEIENILTKLKLKKLGL
jgi:hypothetical protein